MPQAEVDCYVHFADTEEQARAQAELEGEVRFLEQIKPGTWHAVIVPYHPTTEGVCDVWL